MAAITKVGGRRMLINSVEVHEDSIPISAIQDIKAEIENECKSIGDFPIYDNVLVGKHLGLMVAIDIINQHISGK